MKAICLALTFVYLSFAESLFAACSSPAGVEGQFMWIPATSDMRFCDNTNTWVTSTNSVLADTCSTAGKVRSTGPGTDIQYCNGTNWVSMNSAVTNGSCVGSAAGTFRYSFTARKMEWCDGATWKFMTAPSGPSFVASDGGNSTVTTASMTVNKPAGVANGDLLIAVFVNYAGTPVTPPSGWTQRVNFSWFSYSYYITIFTKTAGGSEPASYSFVVSATNGYRGGILAYRNATYVTASSPVENFTNPNPYITPSVSGVQSGDIGINIVIDRSTGTLTADEAGTNRYYAPGTHWSILMHEFAITGTSTGTRSVTRGGTIERPNGCMVVLR